MVLNIHIDLVWFDGISTVFWLFNAKSSLYEKYI